MFFVCVAGKGFRVVMRLLCAHQAELAPTAAPVRVSRIGLRSLAQVSRFDSRRRSRTSQVKEPILGWYFSGGVPSLQPQACSSEQDYLPRLSAIACGEGRGIKWRPP